MELGKTMLFQQYRVGPDVVTRTVQLPYTVEVEMDCEECGGSGYDPGGIDPWGPEPCPVCHGAKTQTVVRNYLAEAFRIAADPGTTRPVERQHLVAIIQYCRELVSAFASLRDSGPRNRQMEERSTRVPGSGPARRQSRRRYSRRKRKAQASRERSIEERKEERIYATFRTKRT